MSNNNYSNEHVSGVSSSIADRSKQNQNHHRFYPTQSAGNERIVVSKKQRDKKQGYIPGLNTGAAEITISEGDINDLGSLKETGSLEHSMYVDN